VASTRRALLLINPNARRPPNPKRLARGIAWLEERGWQIGQQLTSSPEEIAELAAGAAATGCAAVVACGGDGTLHDALPGLAGTQTALAVVPSGTANVWAGEAHLPHDPLAALRLLEEGDRVRLDTGTAGGRPFLLMASLGLDSLVAGHVSGRLKRYFSFLPYLAQAAWELPHYRGVEAEVTVDGERIAAPVAGILVGNTRSYGGLIEVAAEARADDGLLDLCILHGAGRRRFVSHVLRAALRRHVGHPQVTYRQVRTVTVTVDPPWPVQLDGEVAAQTPITFECMPRSLTVVVPRALRTPLWYT
jgi:YegS/Rv2252/BmrU family lipid kinase